MKDPLYYANMRNDPIGLIEDCGVDSLWVERALVQYGLERTREAIKTRYQRDIARLQERVKEEDLRDTFQGALDERLGVMPLIEAGLPFLLTDSNYEVPGIEQYQTNLSNLV